MTVKVVLVDINVKMVGAWRDTFEENPEVVVVQGSMLDQKVDAWVTPTNSKASMDGGLDAVIKKHLGAAIEGRVQKEVAKLYGGFLPVGHATCVETGRTAAPRYVISTPTMTQSSQDISDSLNVALACAAAFQAVHVQNARAPGSLTSVALPGLGANTGRVPVEICADLMWTAYNMFRARAFGTFAEMRAALEEELGDLDPTGASAKKAKSVVVSTGASAKPSAKAPGSAMAAATAPGPAVGKKCDDDFDDHG
jgi:O-acetyl-ADP-ribose deacetylase (regulator of RNase III)